MADRTLHLIGSYPASSTEEAMREMLELAGPHLRYLPDGETGERRNWIVHIIQGLRAHPDLEVVKDGDYTSYDTQLNFRVRRGHRLSGDSLDFGHVASYTAARPVFDELRRGNDRRDLVFQAGIPGDLDMALFTLGPLRALRHRRPFTDAVVREITEIRAAGGDDVLLQLEIPAEQVFVASAPKPLRRAVAAFVARGVARLAERAPAGTRFGVHLCLGDLGHKALAHLSDAGPLVVLANALARRWPAGRRLEFVHVPLAAGEDPPPTDRTFYAPLRALRLPPHTRLVAGFLHESRSDDEARSILREVEQAVGGSVDVAASCGLGRRGAEAARRTVEQGVALCGDSR